MLPLVDRPYLLWVGNWMKHKNLGLLLKSFSIVKYRVPHSLVLVTPKKEKPQTLPRQITEYLNNGRIVRFQNLDDQKLINLYTFADLFVFSSLYEGFGLPPLEAIASRCPVVVSDIPVFREVFGSTGQYFDPFSPDDLSRLLVRLLTDKNERRSLYERQKIVLQWYDKEKNHVRIPGSVCGGFWKMKVLQINKLYYPWVGGVEKVVPLIAEGLSNRIQMSVLVCQPRGLYMKKK
ncbi:MAG: glycosyltransferase [Deltaproteobacteria bacterium]|nr:glycosyltransferase [Deltaproteobacteria bacterium]